MKIVLVGYMGSGKSTVGKSLSHLLSLNFKDLDQEIEANEKMSISEIFSKKGEVYFRKKEMEILKSVLNDNSNLILATGGGTPCLGNTMEFLNSDNETTTIYLKSSIDLLTQHLYYEKEERPLISHLKNKVEVKEFISKHLFERAFFYNQAKIKVNVDGFSAKEIAITLRNKLLI